MYRFLANYNNRRTIRGTNRRTISRTSFQLMNRRRRPPPPPPPPPSSPPSSPPPETQIIISPEPIISFTLEERNVFVYERLYYQMEEQMIQHSILYAKTLCLAYGPNKSLIKNDICPILQTEFGDKDLIRVFECNHAIDASTFDDFISHFRKCPLCNRVLL